MKRYLLIAGDNYYPNGGTGDWIEDFNTKEEIEVLLTDNGTRYNTYHIKGFGTYDWYEIVDIHEWGNGS